MIEQFLEIAVSDVMAAPVRNSIKLYAVREFHCPDLLKPLELPLHTPS